MAAIKDTLLDKDGNEIYLKTVTDNVFDSEGNRLDNVIGSIKENLVGKISKSTIKSLSIDGTTDAAVRITVNGIDTRTQLILGFVPSSVGAGIRSWSFASYTNVFHLVWSAPNERVVGKLYYITISDLN